MSGVCGSRDLRLVVGEFVGQFAKSRAGGDSHRRRLSLTHGIRASSLLRVKNGIGFVGYFCIFGNAFACSFYDSEAFMFGIFPPYFFRSRCETTVCRKGHEGQFRWCSVLLALGCCGAGPP